MLILLLNWLFNGLLLSFIYFLLLAYIVQNPHSFLYNSPEWIICALGFGSVWILILLSFTRPIYYLLRLISPYRKLTADEAQRLSPLLAELIQNINTHKGTNFQLNKLRILVIDTPSFHSQALASNIISISTLSFNASSGVELKAVLASQLAHLYYKDSLVLCAVLFASIPSRLLMGVCDKCMHLVKITLHGSGTFKIASIPILSILLLLPFILFFPLILLSWLGRKLYDYSLRFITRCYAARAAKFAHDLGYPIYPR